MRAQAYLHKEEHPTGAEDTGSLCTAHDRPDDAVGDATYDTEVSETHTFEETPHKKPTYYVDDPKKPPPSRTLFGLKKEFKDSGLSGETDAPSNRFDYEKKYPPDAFGEALAENARVWLTYLDEADADDRDKFEGWKDNIDVLLVFTGLFSGIVSAFLIQSSQSLQQDFVQVSASLLFEMVQLQRAHFSGMSIDDVPSSPLTPNSPFSPSTNAMMVNALWFASLTVSLITALFAVLTKQWFRSYLSAVPGTALEKVKVRHFRFQGIVRWKVGFIVDLLPVLVHISLGVFLIGLIIFVFPLDIHIAWAIIIFAALTITFYTASVILPIRYPDCPYTISLTIFAGNMFYFILPFLGRLKRLVFPMYLQRFLKLVQAPFQLLSGCLVRTIQCGWNMAFPRTNHSMKSKDGRNSPRNWREESLRKAIKETEFLDLKALHWLHTITSNQSIQRIIARSISIYPGPINDSGLDFREVQYVMRRLRDTVPPPSPLSTDVKAFSHQLATHVKNNGLSYLRWEVIPIMVSHQFREKIAEYCPDLGLLLGYVYDVMSKDRPDEPLPNLEDHLDLRNLVKWCYILANRGKNATLAGYVLTSSDPKLNPFELVRAFAKNKETDTSYFKLDDESLLQEFKESSFEYISRCFWDSELQLEDSKRGSFESRYVLLVSVYRNLTSDEPLIMDDQGPYTRESSLESSFVKFQKLLDSPTSSEGLIVTWQCLKRFQQEILLDDAFWGRKMTGLARRNAVRCFNRLLDHHINKTGSLDCFFSTETEEKELRFAYQWCSQSFNHPQSPESLQESTDLSEPDSEAFVMQAFQLFMREDDAALFTAIRGDDDANSNLGKCLICLRRSFVEKPFQLDYDVLRNKYLNPNLIRILKAVSPSDRAFPILYDLPNLVRLCWYFAQSEDSFIWNRKLLKVLRSRSKLGLKGLGELYKIMINELGKLTAESDGIAICPYKFAYQLGRATRINDSQFSSSITMAKCFRSFGQFRSVEEMVRRFSQDVDEQERKLERFGPLSHKIAEVGNWAFECIGHQSSNLEEGEKLV